MEIRICNNHGCGKAYRPTHEKQKYCSMGCYEKAAADIEKRSKCVMCDGVAAYKDMDTPLCNYHYTMMKKRDLKVIDGSGGVKSRYHDVMMRKYAEKEKQ